MRNQSRAAPDGEAYHGLLVYAMRTSPEVAEGSDRCRRILGCQPDPGEAAAYDRRGRPALHNQFDGQAGTGAAALGGSNIVALTGCRADKSRARGRGRHPRRYGWPGIRRAVRAGDTRPSRAGSKGKSGDTVCSVYSTT
jgi:hypothetical protein